MKNQIKKLAVVSLLSTVGVISLQRASLANTYRITFKEGPLDIKCPIIFTSSKILNLHLIKSETCSLTPNISVDELERELGSSTLDFKPHSPYNKKGVLVDVLPPSNKV